MTGPELDGILATGNADLLSHIERSAPRPNRVDRTVAVGIILDDLRSALLEEPEGSWSEHVEGAMNSAWDGLGMLG